MSDYVSSRTKDEAAAQAPITLVFGAKSYEVPLLRLPQERAWRGKLNKVLYEVVALFDFKITDATKQVDISRALNLQLMQFPRKIIQMVFAYDVSKVLPRKVILKEASSEQFAIAFAEIMAVAYPFLGSLAMAIRVTRGTTPNLPQSMRYSN